MIREIGTLCEEGPELPVTVTVYVPVGVLLLVVTVRVTWFEPPDGTVTVLLLRNTPGPEGMTVGGANCTVPEKPLELTTVIVEDPVPPW